MNAYTDYTTMMAQDGEKVLWENTYAGFLFQVRQPEGGRAVLICFDCDGVERGWQSLEDNGAFGASNEGFPFWGEEELWKATENWNWEEYRTMVNAMPYGEDFAALKEGR